MEHFRIATANRRQFDHQNSGSLSAVNAVCLANDLSWEEGYLILLNQSRRYGLLPDYECCVWNMLVEAGYTPVEGFDGVQSYGRLSEMICERYPGVTSGLAVTTKGRNGPVRICAVRRHENAADGFFVMDTRAEPRVTNRLWLRWDEIGAKRPTVDAPDAIRVPQSQPEPSHDAYRYFQPNPRNNAIGDCVIRAYAAVFDVSWDAALDMVARSNEYATTYLNQEETYRYLASEYGLTYHDRMTRNGKSMTGREFCAYLTAVCRRGERVFAQSGSHHVVGIVPVDTPDGKRYVIRDSWDSSERKIGKYFAYVPEKKREPAGEKIPVRFAEGAPLSHPRFGIGTIGEIAGDRVTLVFPQGGARTFSKAWVLENCQGAQ